MFIILSVFLFEIVAKGTTSRHLPKYRIKRYHYHHLHHRLPRVINKHIQRPKISPPKRPPTIVLPEIQHFYHYCTDHAPSTFNHQPTFKEYPSNEHDGYNGAPKTTIIHDHQPQFDDLFSGELDLGSANSREQHFKNFEHLINVVGKHESRPDVYEFVEIPDVHSPPLEHDPTKATYDTPGALNSYGSPVGRLHQTAFIPSTLLHHQNFKKPPMNIEDYFEIELNGDDVVTVSDNKYRFHTNKDLIGSPSTKLNDSKLKSESQQISLNDTTTIKYPNHRYD